MQNLLESFITKLQRAWQQAKNSLAKRQQHSSTQEIFIDTDDIFYPLANIIAEVRPCPISKAIRHPLINFLRSKQKQIDEDDHGKLEKVASNFSNFLSQEQDTEVTQMFLNYFASPSGLFLFRCSILSTLFFSKFLNKEVNNPELLKKVFTALSDPDLYNRTITEHDKTLNQILSESI